MDHDSDPPQGFAVSRPEMPGYGVEPVAAGLLPWSWAVARLRDAHDYWLATTRPDGRPHVMPVWAVWLGGCVLFSCGRASRKAGNLAVRPLVAVTTDNPLEPVVVEGSAVVVADPVEIAEFADAADAKYETDYGVEFYGAADTMVWRVIPSTIIAIDSARFTASPTRWRRR